MRILNYIQLCGLFVALLVTSCDTWEDDLNVNPNYPTEGGESTAEFDYDPSEFMLDMTYNVVSGWDYIHWNVGSAVCEYHGKTISLSQGNRHQAWHAFDDADKGGPWVNGYEAVRYIRSMRNAAKDIGDISYQAIADIWECYDFFNLTLLYGDIPYFQSVSDNPSVKPAYDKQEDIYFTLMAKLKAAGLQIDPAKSVDAASDLIFYGDMELWKKFANTLLIRYAMYMSDAAPDSAKHYLNEVLNNPATYPVMASNSDNAKFNYDGVEYLSRYYKLASSKLDEAPFSNVFIERLISLNDPRLVIYANPVKYVHTDSACNVLPSNSGTDKYAGHIYGITTDNAYASSWNSGSNYASKLGTYFRTEDDKGTATRDCADVPMVMASYAEMLFFLAEATEKGWISTGVSANEYYDMAVKASLEQYDASFTNEKYNGAFGNEGVSSVDEYLTQPSVAYEGGRDKLTLIAEQKWIGSFLMMFDSYFDHRRTMLPELRASSGSLAYAATGSATKFPARAAYPASEVSYNTENVNKAKAESYDIPIVDQASRNLALMWLVRPLGSEHLQMPVFQEPSYKAEYPCKNGDAAFGTEFHDWYKEHWNTMFWWK